MVIIPVGTLVHIYDIDNNERTVIACENEVVLNENDVTVKRTNPFTIKTYHYKKPYPLWYGKQISFIQWFIA